MARSDRFPWQRQDRPQDERLAAYSLRVLRRDGAPLAISLVLHVLALLLIAPWLVMRSIPAPQIEVEVLLEPDTPEPPSSRPEKATRLRALVKVQRPPTQSVRPRLAQIQALQSHPLQSTVSLVQLPQSPAPVAQEGQGQSGRGAYDSTRTSERSGAEPAKTPAPREVAGLSAPSQSALASPPQPSAAAPTGSDDTTLQRGSAEGSPVAPLPSLGSTPQPSARAVAASSRPGEDRQDGPVTLAGPVPQAQAVQPEFRQAARQGGQASLRGGSQAPDDGLSRQTGAPDQIAMLAARAAPQALPGSGAGRGGQPALDTPTPRSSGQGGVAVAERGAAAGPALAAAPAAGQGAPLAIRAQPGSGQSSAGLGSGSRTVSPGERGSGLLAAAPPGAAGPGTAAAGAGPGASAAGEGRAQQLSGSGSAAREAAAPLLAAAGGGGAARGATDSGNAMLSGRAEPPAPAQPVREARATPMQNVQPSGQAKVIEERFTAPALKVSSPRTICELPLLFAGFDRKPIPKGLDTINASEPMQGEVPPRHLPSNEAPRYPLQALGARAQGRTLVRAEIRPDGVVGQLLIKQSSGFQALDLAALETVRMWRFVPAQRHGMAVAMWMDVPIEYKLP
jgi:TonB family protein